MSKILSGFRKRSIPLAADYRPMYKVALIILILKKSSIANKASLNKLHFLSWAIKSEKNMEYVNSVLDNLNSELLVSWGIEPALNKALRIAVAEHLVHLKNDRYSLTETGEHFFSKINSDGELLQSEKRFLERLGKKKASEQIIEHLTQKLFM